jgi:hypothetical protein
MAVSYTFSYYAIAAVLPLTFANYMFEGLMSETLDEFYVDSWKVFLVIIAVFNILVWTFSPFLWARYLTFFIQAPISYIVIRFRLGQQRIRDLVLQTLATIPLITLYFAGLSFHLSKAILSHFVGINIEWTSTAKELESTSFFVGLDRIITDFAAMYIILLIITGGMIYLGLYAPVGWTITNWTAILPLAYQMVCHFLVPIILAF